MVLPRARRRSVSVVLAMAIGLAVLGAVPAHADTACSPSQFSIDTGSTTVLTHGSTHFTEISDSNLGSGTLTWDLKGVVSGNNTGPSDGNISGFLEASIDWDDAKLTTTFSSFCVLMVWTKIGFVFDNRYYGEIHNMPTITNGGHVATGNSSTTGVAYMHLERLSPRHADLAFLLGTAAESCFSGNSFTLHRDNAIARGQKTGNAARAITDCID